MFTKLKILISAGFDAAEGHSDGMGGLRVSPEGFALMCKLMMELNDGNLVLALEGGYELTPLENCASACIECLIDPDSIRPSLRSLKPSQSGCSAISRAYKLQKKFWPCLREDENWALPKEWRRNRVSAVPDGPVYDSQFKERPKPRLTIEGKKTGLVLITLGY